MALLAVCYWGLKLLRMSADIQMTIDKRKDIYCMFKCSQVLSLLLGLGGYHLA